MNIRDRYQDDLQRGVIEPDTAQQAAVNALQDLHDQLSEARPAASGWRRLLGGNRRKTPTGLYLYGPVGRGKTYLVDAFYAGLPFKDKRRLHFHHFMRHAHREMRRLKEEADPLRTVAARFAAEARILCLDELFVHDIADAMILSRLLTALVNEGVTLVATSNEHPDELYRDGLQRIRFFPAIDFLKSHMRLLSLDGGKDYRLDFLESAALYHVPSGAEADTILNDAFDRMTPEPGRSDTDLEVEGRVIPVRRLADGVAWFDFQALCGGPRSQNDYIELARCLHTVLVSNIPRLDREHEDEARRFIGLVDELYDRRVKLICSADAPVEALYSGRRVAFEFRRTVSRLTEMQSHDYLASAHRP